MLSERKYCYCHPSSEEKHGGGSVSTMAGDVFCEWSKQPPPPPSPLQHNCSIPDVSEKLANLSMVDRELPEGCAAVYATAHKRPSIFENAISALSTLFGLPPRNGTKLDMGMPSSHCLAEKEQYLKQAFIIPSTPCIPIFETNKNGKGQLTVPLDYSSTVDDISMTPAGVYVQDMASSECSTLRPGGRGPKRRKDSSKAKQHAHAGSVASGKGCDKNRKGKKRHALRRDIMSDNRTLSFDDCYGYDYREAAVSSLPVDIRHPLPQRCHSAAFSPASTGSVGSFQDALQDVGPVDHNVVHQLTCSVSPSCNPPQSIPAKQTLNGPPATETMNTTVITEDHQQQQKCDMMEPKQAGYVVFTDYDVFTTPSASPARRRPRNLCDVISYALNHHRPVDEDEDEERLDHSDYTSDDFTDDEGEVDGLEYDDDDDDDDDDDSVVFCEDFDDLNDDSNSSSGIDEKKVGAELVFSFYPDLCLYLLILNFIRRVERWKILCYTISRRMAKKKKTALANHRHARQGQRSAIWRSLTNDVRLRARGVLLRTFTTDLSSFMNQRSLREFHPPTASFASMFPTSRRWTK